MDFKTLVDRVRQTPEIWDRNCPMFRDKDAKDRAWEQLSVKMGLPASTCKDTFKSLREKYLREREKAQHQSEHHHTPWHLLEDLKFLDPHIVPRAPSWTPSSSQSEDDTSVHSDSDPTDFDRQLIWMVRKASPIWDRNSNIYPNKGSKLQLWENIGNTLHRDINTCMLRWKALREKYIRQKAKFQEGESKWELLDDLNFLDKVIQYRRKQSEMPNSFNSSNNEYAHRSYHQENPSYIEADYDNSFTDSSNDFINVVKKESSVQQVADSSFHDYKRHSDSSASDYASAKRVKSEEKVSVSASKESKNPEQLFGDLVASLLSKKPESQRNLYMIEIMTVLSK